MVTKQTYIQTLEEQNLQLRERNQLLEDLLNETGQRIIWATSDVDYYKNWKGVIMPSTSQSLFFNAEKAFKSFTGRIISFYEQYQRVGLREEFDFRLNLHYQIVYPHTFPLYASCMSLHIEKGEVRPIRYEKLKEDSFYFYLSLEALDLFKEHQIPTVEVPLL